MASTTLSFFTSPSTTAIKPKSNIPKHSVLSKANFTTFTPNISSAKLTFSRSPSTRFSPITKFSQTEAPVLESEPIYESTEIIETTSDETPKSEQIFAVVMIGSRQYIVFPGRFLVTQRLKGANVNDKIILNKVLLVGTKTSAYIGKPVVTNAAVHAVVEDNGLNPKVIVYKYKRKKNYRRNIGHRQPNTMIRITGITGYQDYPVSTLDSIPALAS